MIYRLIRDQWFLVGVLFVTLLTLWNPGNAFVTAGESFAASGGNELCLALIFVLSGIGLEWRHLKEAVTDWRGAALSLAFVFGVAPLLAWALSLVSPSRDLAIGLFLIGCVSTTQASGIVMAAAAGGRAAHALLITILGNVLCVFTIPFTLNLLVGATGQPVRLPWPEMMSKLALLILVPLAVGMALRRPLLPILPKLPLKPSHLNRALILVILFIGLSKGRSSILDNGTQVVWAVGFSVVLHALKAAGLWSCMAWLGRQSGQRESVFFMGIQKTLPQAIWLQSAYFADYGMALVFCVIYHITQLVIDSWFVGRLAPSRNPQTQPNPR